MSENNTENKIKLKSINELLELNFFIPNYQRGYRWTKQQVEDLLNDIDEFITGEKEGFYCLQPLVVKNTFKSPNIEEKAQNTEEEDLLGKTIKPLQESRWEVIDGQQRLTTIYLILNYLEQKELYSIKYATRKNSETFLSSIEKTESEKNIDYHFMYKAKSTIDNWFEKRKNKELFKDTLLERVKFIWYQTSENAIPVFTRLNIGKIPLTNSELIKALFLNRSNFSSNDIKQQEIAREWDSIEYALQNNEFWLFLHKKDYEKPARIEFLFDIICEEDLLKTSYSTDDIGYDSYKTFRYFYKYVQEEKKNISTCWKIIKRIFQSFEEWFNDVELYHYIGYLICLDESGKQPIKNIYKQRKEKTRTEFIAKLKETITEKINLNKKEIDDLKYDDKRDKIKKILLLHNIQTVVNQNTFLIENNKYKLPIFYKFPFHLYKQEKWDVEHIDSSTANRLTKEKEQREWLKYSLLDTAINPDLKTKISTFIKDGAKAEDEFENLYNDIINLNQAKNALTQSDKDKIGNLTLLDSGTNRGYQNAIFPAKRRIIIGKDKGRKIEIKDDLTTDESNGTIAFIPPCTKNVFLKYYSTTPNNIRDWDNDDAVAYSENIKETLKDYLKVDTNDK